jgi:hypothetical protein
MDSNVYELDDRGSIPDRVWELFFYRVHTGSGPHLASYPMGTGDSFPEDKAAGAWSWPLTSR